MVETNFPQDSFLFNDGVECDSLGPPEKFFEFSCTDDVEITDRGFVDPNACLSPFQVQTFKETQDHVFFPQYHQPPQHNPVVQYNTSNGFAQEQHHTKSEENGEISPKEHNIIRPRKNSTATDVNSKQQQQQKKKKKKKETVHNISIELNEEEMKFLTCLDDQEKMSSTFIKQLRTQYFMLLDSFKKVKEKQDVLKNINTYGSRVRELEQATYNLNQCLQHKQNEVNILRSENDELRRNISFLQNQHNETDSLLQKEIKHNEELVKDKEFLNQELSKQELSVQELSKSQLDPSLFESIFEILHEMNPTTTKKRKIEATHPTDLLREVFNHLKILCSKMKEEESLSCGVVQEMDVLLNIKRMLQDLI